MATKTFKTRIKLKYDSSSNWLPNGAKFQGLAGELLIGSDDNYLRIGTGDIRGWEYAKMSADNVNITSYTSGNTEIDTAQAAIADLNSRINTITGGMVTSFGGKTGAITLNDDSGLSISDSNVLTIAKATGSQLGVVKVTTGNGLEISNGVISMNVATANNAGAVKVVTENGLSLADDGTISMGLASASANGVMSSAHYTKLEGIEPNAELNIIEAVQVNGTGLTVDGDRAVNITIAEGTENGKISVNGTGVAVHGLGSAAYTDASAYATAAQGTKADTAVQTITGDENVIATRTEGSNVVILSHKTVNPTDDNGEAITVGIGQSKEINIPFISFDTTGHIENHGTQKVTITIPNASDLGLSNALHFLGVTDTALSDESITNPITIGGESKTAVNGDVVLYGQKEFVFDGTKWHELGDASANTTAISEINTKIADMHYTLSNGAANKTITALTQVDGKITAATATNIAIPTSQVTNLEGYTIAQAGGQLSTEDTLNAALGKLERRIAINKDNITTLNSDENTPGSVAHSINTAINTTIEGLDSEVTAGTGTTQTTSTEDFKVLQKVAIADGKLVPGDSAHVGLKKLAATANVNDLIQTDGDCIIFDCGSASSVINPED